MSNQTAAFKKAPGITQLRLKWTFAAVAWCCWVLSPYKLTDQLVAYTGSLVIITGLIHLALIIIETLLKRVANRRHTS